MKGQSRAVAQTRAKEVLLPLVTSLADNFRSVPATETIPSLRKLCNVAVNLYLESLSENPSSATKTDISSVMQVLILARQSELIISTYVSVAYNRKAVCSDHLGVQGRPSCGGNVARCAWSTGFFEELHSKRKDIQGANAGERDLDVQRTMERLVTKYAKITHLHAHTGSSYYSGATGVGSIVDVLNCCLGVGVPQACPIVLERLLEASLEAGYFNRTLIPLLPELRKSLIRHGQSPASDPFGSVFRRIVLKWAEKVLGPQPADSSSKLMTIQQKWTCSCHLCSPVRQFLLAKPEKTATFHRIGAPARKHIEKYLESCAGARAAKWDTIRTTPQGLTVRIHINIPVLGVIVGAP